LFSPELLAGKVAIVTGGSRGGMLKEIAKQFLLHKAKAVVLMSRNAEKNGEVAKELSAFGTCHSEPGDVRKLEDCKRVAQNTLDKFGSIDILVNGAAGNFLASAAKLSSNGFKTVMEIDTLGTFHMSQSVFNTYMKGHGGVIINMSAALHWSGSALQVHSASAKAGVDTITKTLAVEWGPHKVRVTGIVPGAIEGTEGFERLGDIANMNNKEKSNQAFAKGAAKESATGFKESMVIGPINRFGSVSDIANAALFLASPLASYVSGTNLVVDGGSNLVYPNFLFSFPQFVNMWKDAKL
jgi:peroxisomal 2,4-dienoyl-CoA reductase